jgi:catechol 2,3-dioxygenase-like lactoylglutathione lyase family enzyme
LNFIATRGTVEPKGGGFDHIGLHFPRAEWRKVCERVKRAGVRVQGRRDRSAIYIEDPNGYTVELYCD